MRASVERPQFGQGVQSAVLKQPRTPRVNNQRKRFYRRPLIRRLWIGLPSPAAEWMPKQCLSAELCLLGVNRTALRLTISDSGAQD
jgi:hypothetical protein